MQILSRLAALCRFVALLVPVGVLGHLAADAFDLHRGIVAAVTWTPAHVYLAALAIASSAWIGFAGRRLRGDLRRRAALLVSTIPGGGGLATVALAAPMLAAFILTTQGLEGAWDTVSVVQAVVVALVASLAGSFAVAALRAALPVSSDGAGRVERARTLPSQARSWIPSRPYFAYVAVRGNRPPPLSR